MKLTNENLREVSFPVGGIGAGCVGIAGNGRFIDWEIFNQPDKGRLNGLSHFSVRAERNGKVEAVRILNGDLDSDYIGERVDKSIRWAGYGWGPRNSSLCSFPHFRNCELDGEFPVGEWRFSDPSFPSDITMSAWSPFVPGESDLASMPCAMFEITMENTSAERFDYTCCGVICNPWISDIAKNTVTKNGNITQLLLHNNLERDSFEYGELALSTDAEDVSFQEYWYRGKWCDHLEVYWNDMNTPGRFKNRSYNEWNELQCNTTGFRSADHGMLAAHFSLEPGEKKTIRFVLSWYIPNRSNTWNGNIDNILAENGMGENRWKNYYATLCSGAGDAGLKIFNDYDDIRRKVFLFTKTLHDTTIPEYSLQGVTSNLSVLIAQTCLRVEDGTFWGWEGVGANYGSCEGTCQHVWNYAQALSLLFPDLERSIRESHAKYGIDEFGGWHFRLSLPLGIKAKKDWMRPCVDGTFGEIMKIYREWKISGDTEWLKAIWKLVKPAVEFAWSKNNPDRWDPEKSGVISGRQHHTLDMELFGASGWLNGHYLGALKAIAEMAPACGDSDFGKLCADMFEKGRKWSEENLFNGEYYHQNVNIHDNQTLAPFLQNGEELENNLYWDSEHKQLKYQIADGCSIDSHLGQWYSSLYGIGEVFDTEHVKSTLNSIYRYNYLPSMRDFANPWRSFAFNGEGGVMMCVWPEGREKPVIPLPYNSETMTGFEWAFAAHLVMCGEFEKGAEIAKAIRSRYDGRKRNPWNEIECGSNYARSMASFAMLQAYSGFKYDMVRGMIGFAPVLDGDFRCFWSLGKVWGEYERKNGEQIIRILHGGAEFKSFGISAEKVYLNGVELTGKTENGEWIADSALDVKAGDEILFV